MKDYKLALELLCQKLKDMADMDEQLYLWLGGTDLVDAEYWVNCAEESLREGSKYSKKCMQYIQNLGKKQKIRL